MKAERVDGARWRIARHGRMNVEGRIYANDELMDLLADDPALEQVRNVASLPGILGASLAMPDIHCGYGFPIGGVAAFDLDDGVVSPGGVGYDINCGVRLVRTGLPSDLVRVRVRALIKSLYHGIPQGMGTARGDLKLSKKELRAVSTRGAAWVVEQGWGTAEDLERTEESGAIKGADPKVVGQRPFERGRSQLGTLGSGNHFVEVQRVERVFDPEAAAVFGLVEGDVVVSIHTGSRGFGHQICTEAIKGMGAAARAHGIDLPDRQLACAPVRSPEGERYLAAMAAAANFAFANRQLIAHKVRESLLDTFHGDVEESALRTVYDVAHNIAKIERHTVDGEERQVCVHRKGATRALPAGHPELPAVYRGVGQPVLIPGDMGRRSYVLVGAPASLTETFGSCCHGAGRVLSRKAALKRHRGEHLIQQLAKQDIVVMAAGKRTVAEEAPDAYKDVRLVVDTVERAGIARKVAELRPMGVIKG